MIRAAALIHIDGLPGERRRRCRKLAGEALQRRAGRRVIGDVLQLARRGRKRTGAYRHAGRDLFIKLRKRLLQTHGGGLRGRRRAGDFGLRHLQAFDVQPYLFRAVAQRTRQEHARRLRKTAELAGYRARVDHRLARLGDVACRYAQKMQVTSERRAPRHIQRRAEHKRQAAGGALRIVGHKARFAVAQQHETAVIDIAFYRAHIQRARAANVHRGGQTFRR